MASDRSATRNEADEPRAVGEAEVGDGDVRDPRVGQLVDEWALGTGGSHVPALDARRDQIAHQDDLRAGNLAAGHEREDAARPVDRRLTGRRVEPGAAYELAQMKSRRTRRIAR